MDRTLSKELNDQAIEKGSLLARLIRNRNMFYGATGFEMDKNAAIAEAEREASHFDASIFWTEQLGLFYENECEYD